MKNKKDKNKELKETIITGVSFVFGTFLLALCYNLFFVPNNLVVGGVSGLAIIFQHLLDINPEVFIYIMNIGLLIISYIFLGKEETKRVVIGTFLYPLFITLTVPLAECLIPYLSFQEVLVMVILSGLMYGFSNGLVYKFGFSTGGSDVIVKMGRKYLHLSEGKGVLIFNIFIIIAGGLVFGIDNVVYGLIILVIESILVDKILLGISDSKKFMIYTRESNKIKKIIEKEFYTGFTIFPTVGGYSHINGVMIMCVISNRDVNLFKDRILDVDPKAFFVVSDCYEVKGGIKRSNLPFI